MPITFTPKSEVTVIYLDKIADLPAKSEARQYAYYVLEDSQLYVTLPDMSLTKLTSLTSSEPQYLGFPTLITWEASIPQNWMHIIREINVTGAGSLNVEGILIQNSTLGD